MIKLYVSCQAVSDKLKFSNLKLCDSVKQIEVLKFEDVCHFETSQTINSLPLIFNMSHNS